jgi:hypothetical protein
MTFPIPNVNPKVKDFPEPDEDYDEWDEEFDEDD